MRRQLDLVEPSFFYARLRTAVWLWLKAIPPALTCVRTGMGPRTSLGTPIRAWSGRIASPFRTDYEAYARDGALNWKYIGLLEKPPPVP